MEEKPLTNLKRITGEISYLPAGSHPLSADVGFVRGEEYTYIYDVGASEEALKTINGVKGRKRVILSHFHQDHTANLSRVDFDGLYVGKETFRHTKCGIIVTEPVILDDGVHIEILPLPSSHAKGSLLMSVNEEYAFLGDGAYCTAVAGEPCYNVQFLKAQIDALKALRCRYVLLSHDREFIREKQGVVEELERWYGKREKGNPYIMPDKDENGGIIYK